MVIETAVGLLLRLDELAEANWRLVEANKQLEARVGELERRLCRSSRNSSLPPSQDPPSAPPRPRRSSSGRRRGGQPGHEGRYRLLKNAPVLPIERQELIESLSELAAAFSDLGIEMTIDDLVLKKPAVVLTRAVGRTGTDSET
jgi:hypothetical protein